MEGAEGAWRHGCVTRRVMHGARSADSSSLTPAPHLGPGQLPGVKHAKHQTQTTGVKGATVGGLGLLSSRAPWREKGFARCPAAAAAAGLLLRLLLCASLEHGVYESYAQRA